MTTNNMFFTGSAAGDRAFGMELLLIGVGVVIVIVVIDKFVERIRG